MSFSEFNLKLIDHMFIGVVSNSIVLLVHVLMHYEMVIMDDNDLSMSISRAHSASTCCRLSTVTMLIKFCAYKSPSHKFIMLRYAKD